MGRPDGQPRIARHMAVDMNMSVLVVDDFPTMLRVLDNLLRQLDFVNIDEATDGLAALEKLGSKNYGLVLSDWNMEPMSGIELLREIRADPNLAHIPFVMVSAETKAENAITARQAGASDYIVKPFNAETLKAKLVRVLGEF